MHEGNQKHFLPFILTETGWVRVIGRGGVGRGMKGWRKITVAEGNSVRKEEGVQQ